MDKKWLLGMGIILLAIPLVIANEEMLQKIRIGEISITKTMNETLYEYPSLMGSVTFNIISALKPRDVENYIAKSKQRLEKATNNETYIAVITFSRPLSKTELDTLIDKYQLHPLSARFSSYPTGGGNMTFPITETDMDELENGQKEIVKKFKENKEKDPEIIYDENFKLFEGFISVYVKNSGKTLKEIDNSSVLLVDIGPIEQQLSGKIGIIFPGKDIYFEYHDN
jgi:hypothetical protein